MHLIDWIIVGIPLLIVVYLGFRARRHVKGVSDFLAGRRVAGRYVLAVAGGEAGMGLVSLVALFEVYYNDGNLGSRLWKDYRSRVSWFDYDKERLRNQSIAVAVQRPFPKKISTCHRK